MPSRMMIPNRPLKTKMGTQMVLEQLLELVGQGVKVERGGLGVVVVLLMQVQVGHMMKLWISVAQLVVEQGY